MTSLRVLPGPPARVRDSAGDGILARARSAASQLRVGPAAAVIGVAAALIGWLGSWNPSYWGDEAATVLSAEKPVSVLLAELTRVDAVHGLYYLFMHFWVEVFGATELSTRAPSAIAVGLLVAGTVVLGVRLGGVRFGIIAGLVCAVLPRTTFLATEARSYAIGTAIAVWVTVLFVGLWRRREARLRPWVVYGVFVGLASYLFLYLLLLVIVHGAVLASSASGRRSLGRWWRSALVAVAVALPMLVFALAQHNQVSFLAERGYATPRNVVVTQWFDPTTARGWPVPVLCWALILLGVGMVVSRTIRHRPDAVLENRGSDQEILLLGLAWLVIPTAILLAGNAWVAPMYSVRYLSFATPAAALLIAVGIVAAGRLIAALAALAARRVRTVRDRSGPTARAGAVTTTVAIGAIVLVLGAVAVPGYLAQRGPYAKDGGSDLRQLADYIQSHAHQGDAVVFDPTTKPSRRPELADRLYPTQFAAVDAVEISTPFFRRAALWDAMTPLAEVRPLLAEAPTVWALELPIGGSIPQDVADLTAHGYRIVSSHRIHRTVVYELRTASRRQKEDA